MSIVIELTTFVTLEEGVQEVVVLLNSLSITVSGVVQGSLLYVPSVLSESVLL
jgi:hypothetical protein